MSLLIAPIFDIIYVWRVVLECGIHIFSKYVQFNFNFLAPLSLSQEVFDFYSCIHRTVAHILVL
jgi:hypothetical protein